MDTTDIHRAATIEGDNWWYGERRAIVSRELRRIGVPGQALDIGAGAGGNTQVLLDHGWAATAVDISAEAVELARERGIEAFQADAEYLPLPSGAYDLVLALDVLQHIEDDRAAVSELARVLRPGGTALISVPADLALWSAHDVCLGHLRRYDRPALSALIEGGGLCVEAVWSWNVLLRPLAKRRRRTAPGRGPATPPAPPAPINAALRGIVMLERLLPLRACPGETLVARAYRP